MHILFVTARCPYPPIKGDQIRAFHQLQQFQQDGHEVTLLTLYRRGEEAHLQRLESICARVIGVPHSLGRAGVGVAVGSLTGLPLQVAYFRSSHLVREFGRLLREPWDLVYLQMMRIAHFVQPLIGQVLGLKGRTVVDFVDSMVLNWQRRLAITTNPVKRQLMRLEIKRLKLLEPRLARAFSNVIVAGPADAAFLGSLGCQARVIPNGVDTLYFSRTTPRSSGHELVFVGNLNYFPNKDAIVHFVADIFPAIRFAVPQAKLTIVGSNPPPVVQQLAKPGVIEVTGFVPDIRPYLERATLFIAPLRVATGIQNKCLEALAMGLPVVAYPQPAEGLGDLAGLIVAQSPAEMVERVVQLLQDPNQVVRLGESVRRAVMERYDWAVVGRDQRDYCRLLGGASAQ